MAIHLGQPSPAASCDLPGRRPGNPPGRARGKPGAARVVSYSVLLPVRLAMPRLLPAARCALTAPFHPCPARCGAVCFLWRCLGGRPRRALPGTVFPWSPDFPHPAGFPHWQSAAIRPSGLDYIVARTARGQGVGNAISARYRSAAAATTAASAAVSESIAPVTDAGRKWRWKAARIAACPPAPLSPFWSAAAADSSGQR